MLLACFSDSRTLQRNDVKLAGWTHHLPELRTCVEELNAFQCPCLPGESSYTGGMSRISRERVKGGCRGESSRDTKPIFTATCAPFPAKIVVKTTCRQSIDIIPAFIYSLMSLSVHTYNM